MAIPTGQEIQIVEPRTMIPGLMLLLIYFSSALLYNGLVDDNKLAPPSGKKDKILILLGTTGLATSSIILTMLATGNL